MILSLFSFMRQTIRTQLDRWPVWGQLQRWSSLDLYFYAALLYDRQVTCHIPTSHTFYHVDYSKQPSGGESLYMNIHSKLSRCWIASPPSLVSAWSLLKFRIHWWSKSEKGIWYKFKVNADYLAIHYHSYPKFLKKKWVYLKELIAG